MTDRLQILASRQAVSAYRVVDVSDFESVVIHKWESDRLTKKLIRLRGQHATQAQIADAVREFAIRAYIRRLRRGRPDMNVVAARLQIVVILPSDWYISSRIGGRYTLRSL
jgi:hypothetical protein